MGQMKKMMEDKVRSACTCNGKHCLDLSEHAYSCPARAIIVEFQANKAQLDQDEVKGCTTYEENLK